MRNLLYKELKLAASPLSFYFIAFGLMFFLPGYPVLCGAFFVTLGIFQSFQTARETNDIVFSALLPVAKRDVVKGKYLFVCLIELCGFLVMTAAVLLRMTVFADAAVYRSNALMNANFFALAAALVMSGEFNLLFVGGFFRTGYKFARPFIAYIAAAFLTLGAAEALHHIPGLGALNAFGFEAPALQAALLAGGIALYLAMTLLSCRTACRRFEKTDL